MEILALILSIIIAFFAFITLGLSGFGSSLVMVPLMLLFLDIKLVVPATLILNVISCTIIAIHSRSFVKKKYLIPLAIGGLTGAIVGTYFLATFENIILKKIYGVIVILFALNTLFPKIELKSSNKIFGIFSGLIAGLFGAIYQTGGPPIVIYLSYQIRKKEVLRATMLAFWVILDLWILFLYLSSGLINNSVINFSLILLPSLFLGIILGSKIHHKINELLFKKIIGIILVFTGMILVLF
jgi:uncharacterized membrane protein YfcA